MVHYSFLQSLNLSRDWIKYIACEMKKSIKDTCIIQGQDHHCMISLRTIKNSSWQSRTQAFRLKSLATINYEVAVINLGEGPRRSAVHGRPDTSHCVSWPIDPPPAKHVVCYSFYCAWLPHWSCAFFPPAQLNFD